MALSGWEDSEKVFSRGVNGKMTFHYVSSREANWDESAPSGLHELCALRRCAREWAIERVLQRLSGVRLQTGEEFPIFQDRNDIHLGQDWDQRVKESLDAVTFLIAILTPGTFEENDLRENGKGAWNIMPDCLANVMRKDNKE
jgi:hypothetical protein